MRLHPDALAAVARMRAQGMHFWAQVLPVRANGNDAGRPRLVLPGSAGLTGLATAADIAMAWAIRMRLTEDRMMVTASLTLDLLAEPAALGGGPGSEVAASGEAVWIAGDERSAYAHATLTDAAGSVVATATGWFAPTPLPPGARATTMPWNHVAADLLPLAETDLTDDEREVARTASDALARAAHSGLAVGEEVLGFAWSRAGEDEVTGTATLGPHVGNRVGDMHGGAVWSANALAAMRLASPGMQLSSGTVQFLRPGVGDTVTVTARAVRRGRRVEFVGSEVVVGGRTIARGELVFVAR